MIPHLTSIRTWHRLTALYSLLGEHMPEERQFVDYPLLSAELHYFRVPRDDWELMLVRLRQLGANTISTCVPWAWHEPRPGALDFDGHSDPQRDLAGFVRLCGALGLRVLLKPGPALDAGLLGGGIPLWLLAQHPEIHALRPDGQPWRHTGSSTPCVSYLHPTFLEAARRWIAAFSAAVAAQQHPHGPIIAVQVGKEPPADQDQPEGDSRFKLDYNSYVTGELWPAWLQGAAYEIPHAWRSPQTLSDLQQYAALDAFTDWYDTTAVATIAGWLRDDGWQVPVFHTLPAAPWQAGGIGADIAGLAHATGWLGHTVAVQAIYQPFAGEGRQHFSFEEYVHYAYWRTKLVKQLCPVFPAFVSAISGAQDFYFAAAFLGGLGAVNVDPGVQTAIDNPLAGVFSRWAMDGLIRSDGSVRPRFWNVKTLYTLLAAAGGDFAGSRTPADLALGYSHVPEHIGLWNTPAEPPVAELHNAMQGCDSAVRSQLLAQRLVLAGVAFDVIDLDTATPEELDRYRLILAPASAVYAEATQVKLSGCTNLALVGDTQTLYDEELEPCSILEDRTLPYGTNAPADAEFSALASLVPPIPRLPFTIDGTAIGDLVEEYGGNARYTWADGPDVDLCVRHGKVYTYLFVANRRLAPYSGTLTYRAQDDSVLHVQVSMGGPRIGLILLDGDEVAGAAFGGDGSEGGWLVRGMQSSIVFNGGAGVVAPYGTSIALTAPNSGRFQIRRPAGWETIQAYRLMMHGTLFPVRHNTDSTHLTIAYIAEDERGRTDFYLLLEDSTAFPAELGSYFATLLLARAEALQRAAQLCAEPLWPVQEAYNLLRQAATALAELAGTAIGLEAYTLAWEGADMAVETANTLLSIQLTEIRTAHLAGTLEPPVYAALEAQLSRILGIIARSSLGCE